MLATSVSVVTRAVPKHLCCFLILDFQPSTLRSGITRCFAKTRCRAAKDRVHTTSMGFIGKPCRPLHLCTSAPRPIYTTKNPPADIGANLTDSMFQGNYMGKDYHTADLSNVLDRAWSAGNADGRPDMLHYRQSCIALQAKLYCKTGSE